MLRSRSFFGRLRLLSFEISLAPAPTVDPTFFRLLRDSVTRKVFKLRLWGFRSGPTDVPDPLLTSVYSPFNLLRSFKDDVH